MQENQITGQSSGQKVFVMKTHNSADVQRQDSLVSISLSTRSALEKDDKGMFFTLITPVTLKEVLPEPPQKSLFDDLKQKMDRMKLELSCTNAQRVQQPSAKVETFDLKTLESLGRSAILLGEDPTTPIPRSLNEDGEYE